MRHIIGGLVIGGLWAGLACAQQLPARAPGLWQSTTTVTDAAGKPLPNAQNVVTVSCVDGLNDQKFFMSEQSSCTSLTISGAQGTYHINGACAQSGKPVTIDETLTYASPQAVTLTAKLSGPAGPVIVTSNLAWQGACLPGMQPGDEGNIVSGAFSKADNINDVANQ